MRDVGQAARSSLELSAGSASRLPRYAAGAVADDDRPPTELSEHAYGRELFAKCGQAAQLGECWAERICHAGDAVLLLP